MVLVSCSGCTGGFNGLAVVLGSPLCEMYSLARANQWDKAAEIQKNLIIPDASVILFVVLAACLPTSIFIFG